MATEKNTYWGEFETNVIVTHNKHSHYDNYMDFESKRVFQVGHSNNHSKGIFICYVKNNEKIINKFKNLIQ